MKGVDWRRFLLVLAAVFAVAVALNWAVLALFGQRSAERAQHSLVGILLLMGYVSLTAPRQGGERRALAFFAVALIPCYLGTVFPDLDIALLGVRSHRHPLFHSSLSFFALLGLLGRQQVWVRPVIAGYGIGLASHLWWDAVDYGDVRWLPGGLLDRLWLALNGWACVLTLLGGRRP
jgi:hypothetical protein